MVLRSMVWRKRAKAAISICRTRSRVNPISRPISSNVLASLPSSPNRAIITVCSFSGNSKRKRGYYVIDHCWDPDSHSHSRRHAVDHTCQSSTGSHNVADSCTVELCSRSPGYSCFKCRCFNLGFGWWFHADSFANPGCAFERYRELPTDDCANRC